MTEGRKYLPQGPHVCHPSSRKYLHAKIQFYLTTSSLRGRISCRYLGKQQLFIPQIIRKSWKQSVSKCKVFVTVSNKIEASASWLRYEQRVRGIMARVRNIYLLQIIQASTYCSLCKAAWMWSWLFNQSSTNIKNEWRYTCTLPYSYMAYIITTKLCLQST